MHTERSFAAPKTFSDEHIEYWGGVYLEPATNRRMQARLVRFETFLLAPREILAALERQVVVPIRSGLLPAQRAAQKRADMAAGIALIERMHDKFIEQFACGRRAGAPFEKLKHHAYPRRRSRKSLIKEVS